MGKKKSDLKGGLEVLTQVQVVTPAPEAETLPVLDGTDIKALREQGQTIREMAGRIFSWALTAWQTVIALAMSEREVQELPQSLRAKQTAESGIEKYTTHEVPAYRRAAYRALFHVILPGVATEEALEAALDELVTRGALLPDEEGKVRILGKNFSFSPEMKFGEEEETEIGRLLEGAIRRTTQARRQDDQQIAQKLVREDTITLREFLDGEDGIISLGVGNKLRPGDDFHQSGTVQVQLKSGHVWALTSTGTIVTLVNAVMAGQGGRGIFVPHASLKDPKAPYFKGIHGDEAKVAVSFWWTLKRAIVSTSIYLAHRELSSQATITGHAFFMERQPGVALVQYPKPWECPDGTTLPIWRGPDGTSVPSVFFLVERRTVEGDKHVLQIIAVPEHLEDFLKPCSGEYADDFETCLQPLSAILRAAYGEVANAARRQAHVAEKQQALGTEQQ